MEMTNLNLNRDNAGGAIIGGITGIISGFSAAMKYSDPFAVMWMPILIPIGALGAAAILKGPAKYFMASFAFTFFASTMGVYGADQGCFQGVCPIGDKPVIQPPPSPQT